MTTTVSENVSKAMSGVMSTPATAAMAEPTIHDAAVTRFTLMPHRRAPLQRPDGEPFDDEAEGGAGEDGHEGADPAGGPSHRGHLVGGEGGEHGHGAVGEVEHPRDPVDEHQPHGGQGVDAAEHDP